jgi:hypothetical protein
MVKELHVRMNHASDDQLISLLDSTCLLDTSLTSKDVRVSRAINGLTSVMLTQLTSSIVFVVESDILEQGSTLSINYSTSPSAGITQETEKCRCSFKMGFGFWEYSQPPFVSIAES